MSDVLSQNEIDNLLKALNSGEVDVEEMKASNTKQVKNYDFTRPSKFSKDHLRTLEIMFDHFGRLVSSSLPIYLRKNVQVEVINSEAVTYMEFSNSLSNPVILGIVDMNPLEGSIVMELAAKLGYTIVDRMLGGEGEPLDKLREFSEIEMLIINRIMHAIVELLPEPWANVVDLQPRLERIETDSQFAQFISPSEMIAIIIMSIKIGDVEGLMNICLPFSTLEPIMDKLNTKFWYASLQERSSMEYADTIESLIAKTRVPVKAILGHSSVSVSDFSGLQVGDIIRLGTHVNQELDVYVGDIRKFTALPGATGEDYAVRITSIVREEQ